MADDTKIQVNVDFTNHPELFDGLEILVEKQGVNRSIFIRNLVRQAWERHETEQSAREQAGLKLELAKVRNGKKSIKQLKAETS